MGGFDDFDVFARDAVTIACHDQTSEVSRPMILHGFGHGRRRFACAQHNRPTCRWFRKKRRHTSLRHSPGDGGIEHLAQQRLRVNRHRYLVYGKTNLNAEAQRTRRNPRENL
jgi:hypothetical protein